MKNKVFRTERAYEIVFGIVRKQFRLRLVAKAVLAVMTMGIGGKKKSVGGLLLLKVINVVSMIEWRNNDVGKEDVRP